MIIIIMIAAEQRRRISFSRQTTRPWGNLIARGKSYSVLPWRVEGLGAVEVGRRGSLRRVAHMKLGRKNGCADMVCVA